jgi:hypothetical protein
MKNDVGRAGCDLCKAIIRRTGKNGMRQPQASSAAVDKLAAKAAPTAEPSKMPIAAPVAANAPIKPRRPSGACSTRNTIELAYSPPTESPCTTRSKVSPIGASGRETPSQPVSTDTICSALAAAAAQNDLPTDFHSDGDAPVVRVLEGAFPGLEPA